MVRKVMSTIVVFLVLLGLIGCNEADIGLINEGEQNTIDIIQLADDATPERKIIYTVDISFDVNDLVEAADFLDTLIETDEWFDKENITSTRYSYAIRIRTDRLDGFISSLQDEFVLRTYQKEGIDISLEYQDTTNEILSLEAQLERLLELYDQATLSEMILINEQISDIEVELQALNGALSQFDSLAEYSVVNLIFYGSAITTQSPFINRLGNAIVNGFDGLVSFFDGLLIVIATALPFLVVFGTFGFVAFKIYKKRTLRKHIAKETVVEDKK